MNPVFNSWRGGTLYCVYALLAVILVINVICHQDIMYTVKSGIIGFWPYLTRTRTNGQSRSSNVVSMLGQRRRRWANIEPTLGEQQCLLGVYRWTNTLYTVSQEADIYNHLFKL